MATYTLQCYFELPNGRLIKIGRKSALARIQLGLKGHSKHRRFRAPSMAGAHFNWIFAGPSRANFSAGGRDAGDLVAWKDAGWVIQDNKIVATGVTLEVL